ncbi:MAG: hypothetical protein H6656_04615 [Ardenticatenaceae bacterium]|nr:hypothetical protein [Ardenticatenaceae bacterium]
MQDGIDTWLHGQKSNNASVSPYPTIPPLKRSQNFYSILQSTIFETFHSKCAFCETKLKKQNYSLFRYRPFTLSPEIKPNYIWLSWQWPNIYLICETCYRHYNVSEKARSFPLLPDKRHIKINDHDLNQLFDVSFLNQIESPLILDPCWDNPEKFFGYRKNEKGLIVPFPVEDNLRANATIAIFLLDREELGKARKQALDAFK